MVYVSWFRVGHRQSAGILPLFCGVLSHSSVLSAVSRPSSLWFPVVSSILSAVSCPSSLCCPVTLLCPHFFVVSRHSSPSCACEWLPSAPIPPHLWPLFLWPLFSPLILPLMWPLFTHSASRVATLLDTHVATRLDTHCASLVATFLA